jgi:hypothetical protein
MKIIPLLLTAVAVASATGANAAARSKPTVSLTQPPLVMRLDKDEFRIAFGINGERCASIGCNGSIHYRVEWRTIGGATRSEVKTVNYNVAPSAGRTIAVDRQYFDTAEGQHSTDIVKVRVDKITCNDGVVARTL